MMMMNSGSTLWAVLGFCTTSHGAYVKRPSDPLAAPLAPTTASGNHRPHPPTLTLNGKPDPNLNPNAKLTSGGSNRANGLLHMLHLKTLPEVQLRPISTSAALAIDTDMQRCTAHRRAAQRWRSAPYR